MYMQYMVINSVAGSPNVSNLSFGRLSEWNILMHFDGHLIAHAYLHTEKLSVALISWSLGFPYIALHIQVWGPTIL